MMNYSKRFVIGTPKELRVISEKCRKSISTLFLVILTYAVIFFYSSSGYAALELHPPVTAHSFISKTVLVSQVAGAGFVSDNESIQQTSHTYKREKASIVELYQRLFQEACTKSPALQAAIALKKQKSARKYSSWARRLAPAVDLRISQKRTFDTSEDYLNSNTSVQQGDSEQVGTDTSSDPYSDGRDISDWSFNLDLPLYRRSVSLQVDIATLEERLADENFTIKIHELDVKLHELLGAFLLQNYRLINLDNSIRLSKEHVGKIKRGYELRDQTRLALLRAQANLNELESRRMARKPRRDEAFRKLLDFTGLEGDEPLWKRLYSLLTGEEKIAECMKGLADIDTNYRDLEFLVESGEGDVRRNYFLEHSLLYQKIVLDRKLAEAKAKLLTRNEWPELAIKGEYGREEDTRFQDFDGDGSISLVFSVPLFSGGTFVSNTKAQNMAGQVAEINSHEMVSKTLHSIENTNELIHSLQEVLIQQKKLLLQQQEIVRLSLKSYQMKQTTMKDLLTDNNKLIDIKNDLMSTTMDLGAIVRKFAWEIGSPLPLPLEESEITW